MDTKEQYFFDKPGNVKLVLNIFYALCVVLFLLDFVIHRHVYHNLENIWGFYPLYGFVGCVVLVLIAKWMRLVIMREENYYSKVEKEQMQRLKDQAASSQGDHHVDD